MKAWTYATAPVAGPYWRSGHTEVILVEYPDGRAEWRYVDDGQLASGVTQPSDYHRGKELDPHYYPEWYRELDEDSMDVGL